MPERAETPSRTPEFGATFGTADSARGLLMTILGEFVLPNGGSAWTRTVLELTKHLDISEKAARQALARMEGRGHLERERVGRETRWHLTPPAVETLTAGAERIYGFGQIREAWPGRWLVVLASVPERDRSSRYRMTTELNWAGFGSLGQGTWICPWLEREKAAVDTLQRLDVDATIFRSELGDLGSGPELAARAWDLPTLERRYRTFIDGIDDIDATAAGAHAAAGLVDLVHEWRRFPFADPDLPTELLPPTWPAREAADGFATRRAALVERAHSWWIAREHGEATEG